MPEKQDPGTWAPLRRRIGRRPGNFTAGERPEVEFRGGRLAWPSPDPNLSVNRSFRYRPADLSLIKPPSLRWLLRPQTPAASALQLVAAGDTSTSLLAGA